jgi:hypothetical protein
MTDSKALVKGASTNGRVCNTESLRVDYRHIRVAFNM